MIALLEPLLRQWRTLLALVGSVIVGAALIVCTVRSRHWRKVAETAQRTAATLELRNRVTIASLDRCQAQVAAKDAETERRAAEYRVAQLASARDVAAADARRTADRSRIAALEALVRAPANPACRASDGLLRNLEGL